MSKKKDVYRKYLFLNEKEKMSVKNCTFFVLREEKVFNLTPLPLKKYLEKKKTVFNAPPPSQKISVKKYWV